MLEAGARDSGSTFGGEGGGGVEGGGGEGGEGMCTSRGPWGHGLFSKPPRGARGTPPPIPHRAHLNLERSREGGCRG